MVTDHDLRFCLLGEGCIKSLKKTTKNFLGQYLWHVMNVYRPKISKKYQNWQTEQKSGFLPVVPGLNLTIYSFGIYTLSINICTGPHGS